MALNLSTFKTDCDAVSDLLDAEDDTTAHFATACADIKADADSVTEATRLCKLLTRVLAAIGIGPNWQEPA